MGRTDPLIGLESVPNFLPAFSEGMVPANAGRVQLLAQLGRGRVIDLEWSPDGGQIAVATSLGSYVYEATSLARVAFFPTKVPQTSVDFSPDGGRLASGGADGAIRIYELNFRNLLREIEAGESGITRVSYAADGRTIASLEEGSGTVKVWSTADGALVRELEGGELATTGENWFYENGVRVESPSGGGMSMHDIAMSPDGRLLAAVTDRSLRLWDLSSGKFITAVSLPTPAGAVAFSPAGGIMATAHWNGIVWIRDAGTGQPLRSFRASEFLGALSFSGDGSVLATFGWDGLINLWDLEQRSLLETINLNGPAKYASGFDLRVEFGPTGDDMRLVATYGGVARVWTDPGQSAAGPLRGHYGWPTAVALLPDQSSLLVLSASPAVWDLESGDLLRSLDSSEGMVYASTLSPDGSLLALGTTDGRVILWDTRSLEQISSVKAHVGFVTLIAFHPEGTMLATAGSDNRIRLWEPNSQAPLLSLSGQPVGIDGLFFYAGGDRLGALGDLSRAPQPDELAVWTWDGGTGDFLSSITHPGFRFGTAWTDKDNSIVALSMTAGESANVTSTLLLDGDDLRPVMTLEGGSPAFSADGTRAATVDGQGRVWVTDLSTGEVLFTGRSQDETAPGLSMAAFSHDGSLLATAGYAGEPVRLWEVPSGRQLRSLGLLPTWASSIGFSEDDRLLFVGSDDGVVRIWGVGY
jgi:WD40 repeat protein